jgi:hypothetical protein
VPAISAFDDECPAGECPDCWSVPVGEYVDIRQTEVVLDGTFTKAQLLHIASHLADAAK